MKAKKTIPVETVFQKWREEIGYIKEFETQRACFDQVQRDIDLRPLSKN